jgi:arylsulfatase A-like enzyme
VGGADIPFFNSAGGLRGYKGSVYEGGLRVPTIVRLPGRIPAGTADDTPGYFADWFPTLCEAAGLKAPPGLDGESLWPVLTGKEKTLASRRPMVWVFYEYGGQVAVRLGDFKLVRHRLHSKAPEPWEVFDLGKDPGETTNLAAAHADLICQAEELLQREVSENKEFHVPIPGVNVPTR